MLRLILLLTLFAMGCATAPVMQIASQELVSKPVSSSGWVSMDESGTNWQLRSSQGDELVVVGKCVRTGLDVDSNTETWYGSYELGWTDFGDVGPDRYEKYFRTLHDCVTWVEHYAYGGHFI